MGPLPTDPPTKPPLDVAFWRRRERVRRLWLTRAVWLASLLGAFLLGRGCRPPALMLGRESRAEMVGTRHPTWEIGEVIARQPCRRRVREVILHHTWRPAAAEYQGESTVESVLRQHVANGWRNLAYHYLVAPDGTVWLGRPLGQVGTHTKTRNEGTAAVCLILDGDRETPSRAQIEAATTVLRALLRRFRLRAEHNFRAGHGFHRDYAEKSCPGQGITKTLVLDWLRG